MLTIHILKKTLRKRITVKILEMANMSSKFGNKENKSVFYKKNKKLLYTTSANYRQLVLCKVSNNVFNNALTR